MPLTFDLPLEQLQSYTGRNPRPADFDEFWERGLEEMRAQDPRLEWRLAPFQASCAQCHDLFFTGVGGARLHAKILRPRKKESPGPAVLMFHGYWSSAGDWQDKLSFVSAGFTVAALDCRGQGGQSEDVSAIKGSTINGHIIRGLDDAPEKLLFRHIFLDAAQLAAIIMGLPEVDPKRVAALGGSQGGALTIACAALEPRLARAAPVFPFLCDYQRIWEMDQAKEAYAELKEYFRRFDPRHEREADIFTRLGYIDIQFLAPRVRAEVLWFIGLADTVCPPSTQFAVYNKLTCQKRMVLYPDFAHERLPDQGDQTFLFLSELARG